MKKRLLSAFLALSVLFSIMPQAYASIGWENVPSQRTIIEYDVATGGESLGTNSPFKNLSITFSDGKVTGISGTFDTSCYNATAGWQCIMVPLLRFIRYDDVADEEGNIPDESEWTLGEHQTDAVDVGGLYTSYNNEDEFLASTINDVKIWGAPCIGAWTQTGNSSGTDATFSVDVTEQDFTITQDSLQKVLGGTGSDENRFFVALDTDFSGDTELFTTDDEGNVTGVTDYTKGKKVSLDSTAENFIGDIPVEFIFASMSDDTIFHATFSVPYNYSQTIYIPTSSEPEETPSPSPEVTPSPSPEVTPSPSPEVTPSPSPSPTPQAITSVSAQITAPSAGATPETTATLQTVEPNGAVTETAPTITWKKNGTELTNGATFEGGQTYTAEFTLTPITGYEFTSSTTVKVNNDNVTSENITLNSDGTVTIKKEFTVAAQISSVAVTVTTPAPGAAVSEEAASVGDGVTDYSIRDNEGVTWYENNNGTWSATTDTIFQYGKSYKAEIVVVPSEGNQFSASTTATVNGDSVTPYFGETGYEDYDGMTLTKEFAAVAAPTITQVSNYDLYTDADAGVTITLSDALASNVTLSKITIGTIELTPETSWYDASAKTITIPRSSLSSSITATTTTPLSVTVTTNAGDITDASLTVVDTTPYLTISEPASGITITLKQGNTTLTYTAGTPIALTKSEQVTLTATTTTAHPQSYAWTVQNGENSIGSASTSTGGITNDTYTFTPTGSENITASVALTTYSSHTVTVNTAEHGKLSKDGTELSSETTYTVYGDETAFTLTATANSGYKFTGVSGASLEGVSFNATAGTITINPSQVKDNITITPTFATKDEPMFAASFDGTSVSYTKGSAPDAGYTFTADVKDYTDQTASITITPPTDVTAPTPTSSINGTATTWTFDQMTLNGLSAGVYTVQMKVGDSFTSSEYTITVSDTLEISEIKLPTDLKHGDPFTLKGTSFKLTIGTGNYATEHTISTSDGTNWTGVPDGVSIAVKIGNTDGDTGSALGSLPTGIVRRNASSSTSDTTVVTTVVATDQTPIAITATMGTTTGTQSASLTVAKKPITVTPSQTTGITKVYNGDVNCPALTATITDGDIISGDAVTASVTAVFANQSGATLTDKDASDDKLVKFTASLDGADKDNYSINTIDDGSGSITKRPLVVTAIRNITHAKAGLESSKSGTDGTDPNDPKTITANSDDNSTIQLDLTTDGTYDVVSINGTNESVDVTYDYTYSDISAKTNENAANVTISNLATSSNNYSVSPDNPTGYGTVDERVISKIEISAQPTLEYWHTDTLDLSSLAISVTYDNESSPTTYTYGDGTNWPDTISVKWTSTETDAAGTQLSVKDYNGKTITIKGGDQTETTNAVTVKKIPVVVTVGGAIKKTYDSGKTFDPTSNIGEWTTAQSISVALDTTKITDTSDSRYSTAVSNTLTNTTASVSFTDANATATSSQATIDTVMLADSDNFEQTTTNNVTYTIDKRPITITAIKNIPFIWQGTTGLSGTSTGIEAKSSEYATATTEYATASNLVEGETVKINYSYAYPDSSTTGTRTDVTISNLALSPDTDHAANKNYVLADSGNTTTGTGEVEERTISSFTVTAPTQFDTVQTYGDTLALTGLSVTIAYNNNTSETYTWQSYDSTTEKNTWKLAKTSDSDTEVTTVPFTWTWESGSQPKEGETLTHVSHDQKGITVTYTGNCSATDGTTTSLTKTTEKITVNAKEISNITVTGSNVTKKYDGTQTIRESGIAKDVPTGWTYTITDTLVGNDSLTIAPTKVDYDNIQVGESKTLVYTWGSLAAASGNSADPANYTLAQNPTIATGAPTGTIEKRPITLTGITNVPSINQYANNEKSTTAVTASTNNNTATFAEYNETSETGIIANDNVTLTYQYKYDNKPMSTTDNAVTLSDLTLSDIDDAKYTLTNESFNTTGSVVPTGINSFDIVELPAQFKTDADVQYGDKLSLEGLTIKADYGNPSTYTEYYKFTNGSWTKSTAQDGTYESADSTPFELRLGDESTAMPAEGTVLTTIDSTGKAIYVVATNVTTESDGLLKVGKRKVTVTPAIASGQTITKVYDGNTDYTGSAITYTVALPTGVTTDYTLPTDLTASGTATFDHKNASTNTTEPATKVTVASYALSATSVSTDNFEITGSTSADLTATIAKRTVKLIEITNVRNADQYSTPTKVENQTATSASGGGATFETTDDTAEPKTYYAIVANDTVKVTYSYTYNDTIDTTKQNNVDLSDILIDTTDATSSNYQLATDVPTKATGALNTATVTMTVTNPSQFNSTVRYGDELDISGLKVEISTQIGDNTTTETYTASVSDNTVTWTDSSNNTVAADDLPFTLSWAQAADNSTFANGNKFGKVGTYQIQATHKTTGSDNQPIAFATGDAKNVAARQITAITATLAENATITKVYDGSTALGNDADGNENANKITYSSNDILDADKSTVTLSATPKFAQKDVKYDNGTVTAIDIEFENPTLTDESGNYTLGDNPSVTGSITGTITAKPVTITDVYIPSTYKKTDQSGNVEKEVTSASLAESVTTNTYTATGFVGNEGSGITLAYTIVYAESDIKNGTPAPTVTFKENSCSVSGTGKDNYTYTWPTSLTGTIVEDEFTDVSITQPTKMSDYTHGDAFDPSGMIVTIKTSSDTTGKTYTIQKDNTTGKYSWDTALPNGVKVTIGTVSLTSSDDLNRNAHYTNMNGKNITLTAGEQSVNSTDTITVSQANLTITPTLAEGSSWEKTYDGTTEVKASFTYGIEGKKTFNGTEDNVGVTATAAYKTDADVWVDSATSAVTNHAITFTGTDLTGNDKDNYTFTAISDITDAKINPYTVNITAIGEKAADAYYKQSKNGEISSTTDYTAEMGTLAKPAITLKYDYGTLVNTVANEVDVPITTDSVEFVTATNNFTLNCTATTIKGAVKAKNIASITISKTNIRYKYGDVLNLSDLTGTVTYEKVDGETEATTESFTYGDPSWTALGLTLVTEVPTDGTVLKNSTDDQKTIKVTKGEVSSNEITLTVETRKLYASATVENNATITKIYDGGRDVEQTITLTIAGETTVDGTTYDSVLSGDTIGLSNTTPTYLYENKNVGTDKNLTTETISLTGTNAAEYDLTVQSLTGAITAKTVTVTPVIASISANKFANEAKTITESDLTKSDTEKITVEGLVDEEDSNSIKFGYTVTVSADQLKAASTYTIAPTNTSPSGTSGNYTYTWNSASVEVTANAATNIEVTTDPTAISEQKYYGDSFSLDGMKVTVTYTDGSEHDFTYSDTDGSEWKNEGFTVSLENGGNLGKLKTADNDKKLTVSLANGETTLTAPTTSALKVAPKPITLTASVKSDKNLNKIYDSETDVKDPTSKIEIGVDTNTLVSGDTVDTSGSSFTADYYKDGEKDKNVGENKTVKLSEITGIVIKDGDSNNVTDEYTITQPTDNLTGNIEAKTITLVVSKVPEILTNSTGDALKPEIKSYTYKDDIKPYAGDDISITPYADYSEKTVSTAGEISDVPFEADVTGEDRNNYEIKFEPTSGTGTVVDNIIESITVTGTIKNEYTHGNQLDLTNMVITVDYKDDTDNNTFTYDATNNNWTAMTAIDNKSSFNTTELPVTIMLKKGSLNTTVTDPKMKLRCDNHNGAKLTVSGGTATDTTAATLTVKQKEIEQVNVQYAIKDSDTNTLYTASDLTQVYDGDTACDDLAKLAFVANSSYIVSFNGTADVVNVTAQSGAAAYEDKNVNTTPDTKVITIDRTKLAVDNDNYVLSNNFELTGNVKGNITRKTLTVTINSVPSIYVGENTTVTLEKDTNYTQTGEVTVGDTTETVNVTVTGEYPRNDTATAEGLSEAVTYSAEIKDENNENNTDADTNYKVVIAENPPTGTVIEPNITEITITAPTEGFTFEHGDYLDLSGMVIAVTYYNNWGNNTFTCANGMWTAANAITGVTTGENAPYTIDMDKLPVTLTLGNTALTAAQNEVQLTRSNGETQTLTVASKNSEKTATADVTVNQKTIDSVTVAYAVKADNSSYAANDISRDYNGTTDVETTDLTALKITTDDAVHWDNDGTVDGTTDAVVITTSPEYASKNASESAINLVFPTDGSKWGFDDTATNWSNNYKFADTVTVTATDIQGYIDTATITIKITSVPSVTIGATNDTVTLVKDKNYTQTGEANGENVVVTVTGKYAQITAPSTDVSVTYDKKIDADNSAANASDNYTVTLTDKDGNVIDGTDHTGPTGTVAKVIENIMVSGPTDTAYEHGDSLSLDGLTVTVTYGDTDNDATNNPTKTYEYKVTADAEGNKTGAWYEVGSDGTSTIMTSAPDDFKITWGDTETAVTDGAVIRLDDTDKGLATDGDGKKTTLTVTAAAPDSDDVTKSAKTDVTVAKKQLTLAVSGDLTKVYDSTANITAATQGTLTFTLTGSSDADVSVDETATKANITFPDKNVAYYKNAETNAAEAKPLVLGDIVMTNPSAAALAYYIMPAVNTENPANSTLTNGATGLITKKAFTVTAIEGPSVETGADATGVMTVGKDKYTTDPADALMGGDDVKLTLTYTFTGGTGNADNTANVTYTNIAVASDTDASGNSAVADNYDITITASSGTGSVTGGAVTGVAIKAPAKTEYSHGDKIDLTGTMITVTYDNNPDKTDTYTYDPESEKWTLTKNGVAQTEKVELPSGLKLGFTGETGSVTPDTVVKYANDGDTLTVSYQKDAETAPVTAATVEKLKVNKKTVTITVANKADTPIEQEYSKSKTLSADSFDKLEITVPADFAVDGETVSIKAADKVTAEFKDANVAKDADGTVKNQEIILTDGAYTLDGADADSYELVFESTAEGAVTPKAVTLTAKSVPPINAGAANLVVNITDYEVSGLVDGDSLGIVWQGTYDMATLDSETGEATVKLGAPVITGGENYTVSYSPSELKGKVTAKTVTEIVIGGEPKFSTTDPKHGDKVGEDGLDGLEFTVKYSDGTETKHKMENGEWKTDDGYTAPDSDITLKWNGTTEDASSDSVIRRDKPNTVTISKEGKSAVTSAVTAAAKAVTITAVGSYTKVYDGTPDITLSASAPEITYTIEGLAEGDAVTVKASPAFTDENVAKFGDEYVKGIVFTGVELAGDENILANYTIAADESGKAIADITGAITPKTIKITSLPVPSKSKGASSLDFTKTGVSDSEFTTADIVAKDKGTVTIGYKGTYSSTSSTGENIPVTITEINIEADNKAMLNYAVTPADVTGAVGEVTSGGGGGGGGGGGSSNTLTIRYEPKEEGKTGEAVPSKVTISLDNSPLQLVADFSKTMTNPAVTWTTSNEKIATVDENGLVTFIGEGTVVITATSQSSKSLTDKVEFTVTPSTATPAPTSTPQSGTVSTPTPVPKDDSKITKDMMNPYIIGYDDNMFGPELPISREEVATIFARLIANNIYMDTTYTSKFWDVTDDDWSRDYIGYLETFDILHGYDDGSFMPKAYITRAEMAVMMARAEGYDVEGYMAADEIGYPDIPEAYGTWAAIAIKCLTERGVMEGYEDGTFRPTQPITRAETVATVNRVLADMYADPIDVLPSDMTDAHWAYNDVVFAMNHRVLKDAAADPNKFVWSDEFDKNMTTVEITVPTDNGEDSSPTGTETESASDALEAPEPTVVPTEEPKTAE